MCHLTVDRPTLIEKLEKISDSKKVQLIIRKGLKHDRSGGDTRQSNMVRVKFTFEHDSTRLVALKRPIKFICFPRFMRDSINTTSASFPFNFYDFSSVLQPKRATYESFWESSTAAKFLMLFMQLKIFVSASDASTEGGELRSHCKFHFSRQLSTIFRLCWRQTWKCYNCFHFFLYFGNISSFEYVFQSFMLLFSVTWRDTTTFPPSIRRIT